MAKALRRIVVAGSALIAAALAGAALILVQAGWWSDEPTFRWKGRQTFTCYLDRELRYPTLSVSFSDEGRRAVVHCPERNATITFQRGGLAGDVFRGDGIELVIDPEAYVTGGGRQPIGPCQN